MPHEALRGHKVLVVDDDPRNAFVLTDVLEMHGVTVVQATEAAGDGRAGVGDIDLVLMDVMMPQMDGTIELQVRIGTRRETPSTGPPGTNSNPLSEICVAVNICPGGVFRFACSIR